MGHVRLGRIPTTRKWKEVVKLLGEADIEISRVAEAVEKACDRSLASAVKDPVFIEALWLFLKIPQAARVDDFASALGKLELDVPKDPTMTDVLVAVDAALEDVRCRNSGALSDFGPIAKNAAISALRALANDRNPALWTPTREDERTTLATFASTERFGELTQRFFSKLMAGHIQYFLDRAVPAHIGAGRALQSVSDTRMFDEMVDRHCIETTYIMRAFARDWLGNNRFHLGRELSRRDATGFAAHVFTKINAERSRRSGLQA